MNRFIIVVILPGLSSFHQQFFRKMEKIISEKTSDLQPIHRAIDKCACFIIFLNRWSK